MAPFAYKIFFLMNILYKHAFPVYRALYKSYKLISDKKLVNLIDKKVFPGMHALDIGSNIGVFTIVLSKKVGLTGEVHAFEPDPQNFKRLKQAAQHHNNITTNECAVAERSGTIKLYQSDDMNVDHQTYDNGANRSMINVKSIAIDDYFQNGETIDFVKIDVQGFDVFVLEGMKNTLNRSQHVTIAGEFWPYGLRKSGKAPSEYLSMLEELGFTISFSDQHSREYWCDLPGDDMSYTFFIAEK
jgi:FkbM family methyltransferase